MKEAKPNPTPQKSTYVVWFNLCNILESTNSSNCRIKQISHRLVIQKRMRKGTTGELWSVLRSTYRATNMLIMFNLMIISWAYICQIVKTYKIVCFKICNLLHASYTTTKFFKKKIVAGKGQRWEDRQRKGSLSKNISIQSHFESSFQRMGMFITHKIPFQNNIFLKMSFSRKIGIVFLKAAARLREDD